jgi:hypothetical protein
MHLKTAIGEWKKRFGGWIGGGYMPESIRGWEWAVMRLGFACLVMWEFRDWHPFDFAGQPSPVGLAKLVNLTWLHSARPFGFSMFQVTLAVAAVCSVAYVFNVALRWVLPVLALGHTLIWTYYNSQGYQHHGHQLVTMVLWVQVGVVWWTRGVTPAELRAWLWYYVRGIVLFSYTTSALTKIVASRGLWLWNSKYLCAELVKSHRLSYYKELDPALAGDPPATMWLLHHPFVAQIMFGIGFFIELFAWLGLRDRRCSAIMGAAIIIMHFNIAWLMRLNFDNHVWLCAIFLLNVPGWIAVASSRLAKPQPAL